MLGVQWANSTGTSELVRQLIQVDGDAECWCLGSMCRGMMVHSFIRMVMLSWWVLSQMDAVNMIPLMQDSTQRGQAHRPHSTITGQPLLRDHPFTIVQDIVPSLRRPPMLSLRIMFFIGLVSSWCMWRVQVVIMSSVLTIWQEPRRDHKLRKNSLLMMLLATNSITLQPMAPNMVQL